MAKKRKKSKIILPEESTQQIQVDYMTELEVNPEYSLQVDIENKYGFTDSEKKFIEYYVEYRNINTAANLAEVEIQVAQNWFKSYNVQSEIRRINRALYQKQFARKMLTLDEISGYLSSLITDEYVPLSQQLDTQDKLKVIDTLLKVKQLKSDSLENPDVIIEKDLNTQIKDLSVDTIKSLIETSSNKQEKEEIISKMGDNFSVEEKSYLEGKTTEELLEMLEKIKKDGKI